VTAETIQAAITGVHGHLPADVLDNATLARMVDTSDEWIVERTGIRERRIAAEKETTGDLAINAARDALAQSGTRADEIDLIIVATSTPDNTFPATAVKVQAALGIVRGSAFDLQAVCSGFVYGLTVADSLLKAGQGSCALIIGAETYSRILDWTDRGTCVLFGDGAAAVVLRANGGKGTIADRGILAARLRSDGRYKDKLYVDGGVSSTMTVGHLRMEGREVFKHAVVNIATVMADTIKDAGLEPKDIDWFVPHQANRRILEGTAKKLGVTEERVVMTLDKHGNTSAASIPLALDTAVKDGRIQRGDLVLMEAMGGGFTWGAVLVRW
jgi:3-oxoacyl-[acyl-carrier-protein] synthase III